MAGPGQIRLVVKVAVIDHANLDTRRVQTRSEHRELLPPGTRPHDIEMKKRQRLADCIRVRPGPLQDLIDPVRRVGTAGLFDVANLYSR